MSGHWVDNAQPGSWAYAAKLQHEAQHTLGQPIQGIERNLEPTILQEAQSIVDGDREATYGRPAVNFERTAVFWSVVFGHPVTMRQVALCMVGLKLAREVHQEKRDNLVDAAGYLRCIEKAKNVGYDVNRPHGQGANDGPEPCDER